MSKPDSGHDSIRVISLAAAVHEGDDKLALAAAITLARRVLGVRDPQRIPEEGQRADPALRITGRPFDDSP